MVSAGRAKSGAKGRALAHELRGQRTFQSLKARNRLKLQKRNSNNQEAQEVPLPVMELPVCCSPSQPDLEFSGIHW